MSQSLLSDEDLSLYAEQMTRIKARIDHAAAFLQTPHTYPRVESGLLQLRQALESTVMSSLITNRAALEQVADAYKRRKHSEVYKLVNRLNPRFWPEPSSQRLGESGTVVAMDAITGGYLSQDDYFGTWGDLSQWLHASSPFGPPPPMIVGVELGRDVIGKLITLLNHHIANLVDRSELLVCIMNERESGKVYAYSFSRIVDPPADRRR